MKKISSILVTILFVTSCGGGGGGGSSDTSPPVTNPSPSISSFSSSASSITAGESITLTWSTSNANSCSASGDWSGTKGTNGSETLTLDNVKTYSFTLTCSGATGTSNAVSSVSVDVQEAPSPVINSFTSSSSTINLNESITLEWTSSNTNSCSAGGDWSGSKNVNGSESIQLDTVKTYTFNLTCSNSSTSTNASLSVVVEDTQTEDLDVHIIEDGVVAEIWGGNDYLSFFDELNGYGDCTDEVSGTETCQSVDWEVVSDSGRGDVLEVMYVNGAGHAGLVVGPSPGVNLSDYSEGTLSFDIKIINSGNANLSGGFYIKVESGAQVASGELPISGIQATGDWETVDFPVSSLTASGALNLADITAPMVFFPAYQTGAGLVYQIDNVRFTGIADGATPPSGPNDGGGGGGGGNTGDYNILTYGAGSVSTSINLNSYRCVNDYGFWVYNAGVVNPGVAGCNIPTGQNNGTPVGAPTKVIPQVVEPAASKIIATHRWWGSIPFIGEMQLGDTNGGAHVTADPIRTRVSNAGARIMGLPGGFKLAGGLCANCYPQYVGGDPFTEVFDGIAIANSAHGSMDAYLKDYSDGSATVMWKTGNTDVMEATFIHGSPYVYFKVYDGNPIIKTLRSNSGEKGIFYESGDSLGVWTNVAGNRNNFVITGEGVTTYTNTSSDQIGISNATGEFTVSYIPTISGEPGVSMSDYFVSKARNIVASVDIDYSVNRNNNSVTVTHNYLDENGNAVDTIVGMHPMHWKFSNQQTSNYKIRSARGIIKFAETSSFNYTMPFVGVLPTLPAIENTYDQNILEQLVKDFVNAGESSWINRDTTNDTYWSGKAYGKAAEVIAIAKSLGLNQEASQLTSWLKSELEDWFTAETDGELDELRYFVYDEDWDTILGIEEAYGSHQRLADHHFHYGYFVRAAAEICRTEKSWCGPDQYGPIIELLIRDYAGGDDDDMFPTYRNFDPANGFSWADGKADALQGNNNESTSEAANSYGSIILYGLITGNDELVNKGIYLHTSTSTAYWQYWNDIDGYKGVGDDYKNFIPGYPNVTTSIIWSSGADFSTWFSPAYAHILGIQGLPSNPLILHVSQYKDYMMDYIELGLRESSNGKPSGLPEDQWRDLWWNLIAMVDPEAAISDYNTMSSNYNNEAGESKAHTYHWLHTFNKIGHIQTGTGDITSNYPAALVFKKGNITNYLAYNFSDSSITVNYSDGKVMVVPPNDFKLESKTD